MSCDELIKSGKIVKVARTVFENEHCSVMVIRAIDCFMIQGSIHALRNYKRVQFHW